MTQSNPVRNSLQAVLERQARPEPSPAVTPPVPTPAPAPAVVAASMPLRASPKNVTAPLAEPAKFHRPSREGRRLIAGHFEPKIAKQLKLLAAEEDTTVQSLLEEALDLLFVKKGKNTLTRA